VAQLNGLETQRYVRTFFEAVKAPILREEPYFLQVELPREIDKELSDRPYYWMWVDASGEDVENTVLNLAFDPDVAVDGLDTLELVAPGSFRLEKIFEATKKRGRFTLQYEKTEGALHPLLVVNYKISFIADRCRDEIVSFGIDLTNGAILPHAFHTLAALPFEPEPPSTCTLLHPSLSVEEAWRILQSAVTTYISHSDQSWAAEAEKQLQREKKQLEDYYASLIRTEEDDLSLLAAERDLRISELEWRCQPRIAIKPFNIAILYIRQIP
jgi:hypothetical protein